MSSNEQFPVFKLSPQRKSFTVPVYETEMRQKGNNDDLEKSGAEGHMFSVLHSKTSRMSSSTGSRSWLGARPENKTIADSSFALMKELHLVKELSDYDDQSCSVSTLRNTGGDPFCERLRCKCEVFLSLQTTKTLLAVGTFHLLFSNDLFYLILPKEADMVVLCITLVVGVLLLIEVILQALTFQGKYVKSVFLWLDLVAMFSVVPDILVFFGVWDSSRQQGINFALARVGRAGRIGTMLGRVGHVTKACDWLCCRKQHTVYDFEDGFNDGQNEVSAAPSKVGMEINTKLTTKNACLVLLVILGSMLLTSPPADALDSQEVYLSLIIYNPKPDTVGSLFNEYGSELLYIAVNSTVFYGSRDFGKYREIDLSKVTMQVNSTRGELVLHKKDHNATVAILSVCLTIFVIFSMVMFNFLIITDVQIVLVAPIERMVRVVDTLVVNPLARFNWSAELSTYENNEASHMVRSIKKLGNLIQVGFGEAGTEVISQNLQHGTLFTMLPGRNVQAVFAFCNIRNFTTATEVLRQDVMFFVNQIAAIVHRTVKECDGMPNKNIGDAFLCTWRLGVVQGRRESVNQIDNLSGSRRCAETSLAFALRCTERIEHDVPLRMICEKVGNGYTCDLGYGIHFGWAVEGPIGSEMKVDVSYLSPHVNLAARLEAATRQYGIQILISTDIYNLLSCQVKELYTRPVDFASLKGTNSPLLFYEGSVQLGKWCEVPSDLLPAGAAYENLMNSVWAMHSAHSARFVCSMEAEAEANELVSPLLPDINRTSSSISKFALAQESGTVAVSFRKLSCVAHALYVTGEWEHASQLYRILYHSHDDLAALNIINYLGFHDNKRPDSWEFRALDSK